MKNKQILKNILNYTLIFSILFSIILLIFKYYDKSFVWINVSNDGLDQHLINLHIFKDLLTDFLSSGSLNTFTWKIGYGMDLFANLTYYIFGDFLSYISILVPHDKIDNLYNILIVLRVYLIGISFIIYSYYHKYKSIPTLIGSIIYTFSGFTLFAMARHPYFINPLIIFPLILLGTEKIILDNKKIFFTILVAIMFISSFYFGYMIAMWIIIYGIIIAINKYKNIKKIINVLFKTLIYALIGLLISSYFLLPTIQSYFSSTRTGSIFYLYTPLYYLRLIPSLISVENTGNWSLIGVSGIILGILPIFIKNKHKYKNLYIYLICLIIPLLIPFIATIFDCMSYPNNRWAFIISFILAIITVNILNDEDNIKKIDLKKGIIYILIYGLIILITKQKINLQIIISLLIGIIFLYVLNKKDKFKNKYSYMILLLLIINTGYNIYYMYDSGNYGYIDEFVEKDVSKLHDNANYQIPYLSEASNYLNQIDNSYYNVLIYPDYLYNLSLVNEYNSISYFYSIVDSTYLDLATDLENQELGINKEIKNFNYRPIITTLLNNKYLITTNKEYIPYGYSEIKNFNNETYIFKNNYYLSFANLYTKYIDIDTFNNLSPIEKEISLLKYMAIDNNKNNTNINLNNINNHPYYILNNNISGNKIDIYSKNSYLDISVNNINNSQVYLYIKNLKYTPHGSIKLFSDYSYNITANLKNIELSESTKDYRTNAYYFENKDLLINLGYYDKLNDTIRLTFSNIGTYSFDSFEIKTINFNNYQDDINNLNKANFKLDTYQNNYLSGSVNCETSGILQFATNYSDNFNVYVDNKKVDTFKVNKYFLGINIDSGYHKIYLEYKNPINKVSLYLSILGIILLILLIILEKINIIKKKVK